MIESEREDDEVKHEAMVTLACMAQTLLEPGNIPSVLAEIKDVSALFNVILWQKWKGNVASFRCLEHVIFIGIIVHFSGSCFQVAESPSWHARAAILLYTQVMVFCNLFLLQDEPIRKQIQELVLSLLCDEQLEVCCDS